MKKINLIKFGTNDMTKITVLGGSGFLGHIFVIYYLKKILM